MHDVKSLAKYKEKSVQKVHEAFKIREKNECVSEPPFPSQGKSVTLSRSFIDSCDE